LVTVVITFIKWSYTITCRYPRPTTSGVSQFPFSSGALHKNQQIIFSLAVQWVGDIPQNITSRKLTYPTLGKGKSSSNMPFLGGYVSSLEGNLLQMALL